VQVESEGEAPGSSPLSLATCERSHKAIWCEDPTGSGFDQRCSPGRLSLQQCKNGYHTPRSMKFMHPSGTVIDTARQDGDAQFESAEPVPCFRLMQPKDLIERSSSRASRDSVEVSNQEHDRYSLNAFLDFNTPVSDLQLSSDWGGRYAWFHCRSSGWKQSRISHESLLVRSCSKIYTLLKRATLSTGTEPSFWVQ